MGYEVRICREGGISLQEWQQVAQQTGLKDEGDGHYSEEEAIYYFFEGTISLKNPTQAMLHRFVELATRLKSKVVGDDGELYGPTQGEKAAVAGLTTPTILDRIKAWWIAGGKHPEIPFKVGDRVMWIVGQRPATVTKIIPGVLPKVTFRLDNGKEHTVAAESSGLTVL